MAQEGLKTHRGHTLLLSEGVTDKPVLTVELYCKWYELWVVFPNADIMTVSFGDLDDGQGTPYIDHVPNPEKVRELAEKREWHLNELAEELIVGRWQLEVEENS